MFFLATIWSVAVFCGGATGAEYDSTHERILLNRPDCAVISAAPRITGRWYETAMTVETLAHEEGHAHDPHFTDPLQADVAYEFTCGDVGPCEAFADCYAAGHMLALARSLGFSGYNARRFRNFAHSYRRTVGYSTVPQRCWR